MLHGSWFPAMLMAFYLSFPQPFSGSSSPEHPEISLAQQLVLSTDIKFGNDEVKFQDPSTNQKFLASEYSQLSSDATLRKYLRRDMVTQPAKVNTPPTKITNSTSTGNSSDLCKTTDDPVQSALLTVMWNISLSIALSPIGFIVLFILDVRKRFCKRSGKIEPEKVGESDSLAMVPELPQMTSNESNTDKTTSKEEKLGKILGISEYYKSVVSLSYNIGYRAVFVVLQIKNRNFINPALFAIDIGMAVYFGLKRMYCPGCLYNDIHVLYFNRKFVHVRIPCKRLQILASSCHCFPLSISQR